MGNLFKLDANLSKITKEIREKLDSPNDLTVREFTLASSSTRCAVVFLCGLTDKDNIYKFIIRPLQHEELPKQSATIQTLLDRFFSVAEVNIAKTFPDIINSVLTGDVIVLIDDIPSAVVINSRAWEKRSLESPITEALIRGPRIGFNEDINVNKMLIRRSLRDPQLRFKSYIMGKRSQKEVTLVYIEDIINPYFVEELNRRLQSIVTDIVFETGTIEQLIQDNNLSPFPQFLNTERPDTVVASLAKGKAAILVDGSPFALIAPLVLIDIFQSIEDYYERWVIGTLLRFLRMGAGIIAVLLPVFQTKASKYSAGIQDSIFTFIGFEVALFYSMMLRGNVKKAPLAAAKGVMVTVMSYILIYMTCISVFTYMTTRGLTYPTIELGKEIEIGGGFLERFDAIFFTIWIITVYNTTAMYYDIAALLFCAMFSKLNKHIFIFISAPIIFMINMVPGDVRKLSDYGTYLAWVDMGCIVLVPLLVLIVYKIKRRADRNETPS